MNERIDAYIAEMEEQRRPNGMENIPRAVKAQKRSLTSDELMNLADVAYPQTNEKTARAGTSEAVKQST